MKFMYILWNRHEKPWQFIRRILIFILVLYLLVIWLEFFFLVVISKCFIVHDKYISETNKRRTLCAWQSSFSLSNHICPVLCGRIQLCLSSVVVGGFFPWLTKLFFCLLKGYSILGLQYSFVLDAEHRYA